MGTSLVLLEMSKHYSKGILHISLEFTTDPMKTFPMMPGSGGKNILHVNERGCQPALPLWRWKDAVYFTVVLTSCKDNMVSHERFHFWKVQSISHTSPWNTLS